MKNSQPVMQVMIVVSLGNAPSRLAMHSQRLSGLTPNIIGQEP